MNKRISVLSVPIDCVTMDEAVQRILQLTEQPGLHLVATANAEWLCWLMKTLHCTPY